MIPDHNDFIEKPLGKSKYNHKAYKMLCNNCNADRGYLMKSQDKRPKCNKCCKKGKLYSTIDKEVKYPNVDFTNWIKDENGCRRFKISCISCGKNKGYMREAQYLKQCVSCKNRIAKLGKPSPVRKKLGATQPISKKQYIIKKRMSSRMRASLVSRGSSKKQTSVFNILGYSLEDLMSHLESKFVDGMSWNNMDQWHIDHVIPDSWFHYKDMNEADFKKSWSLNNLQPLWAIENCIKGNRFAGGHSDSARK